jgi:hypothetical protein
MDIEKTGTRMIGRMAARDAEKKADEETKKPA